MYKQDRVSIQNQLRLVAHVVDYQILQPTGQLSPGRPSWAPSFLVSVVKWVAMIPVIVASCSMLHSDHFRVN